MGLDHSKLEGLGKGPMGGLRGRCPACAAKGEDKGGEHLYIYPDGRFGCAKYPKDKSHRSTIARLACDKRDMPKPILRVLTKTFKTPQNIVIKTFGTDGTTNLNLRALHNKFLESNIDTTVIHPAGEIGLGKAVPFVPKQHKPLSINKSEEIEPVPAVNRVKFDLEGWGELEIVGVMEGGRVKGEWSYAK